MYLGIEVHKRYAQVAVMDEYGGISVASRPLHTATGVGFWSCSPRFVTQCWSASHHSRPPQCGEATVDIVSRDAKTNEHITT